MNLDPPALGGRGNRRRRTERDQRFLTDLGIRVLKVRMQRGLTRGAVAQRTHYRCSEATIANIEQGRYAIDVTTLRAVAESLDVGLCTLLTDL